MRKARKLQDWFEYAQNNLKPFYNSEVTILTLIGRDTFERRKGVELNECFGEEIFNSYYDETEGLSIEAFYSLEHRTIFLVLNGFTDMNQLFTLFEKNSSMGFFEKIQETEKTNLQLMLFLSMVSHVILFIEQGCRFDVGLARNLKMINKLRLEHSEEIIRGLPDELLDSAPNFEREERFALPRFAFAFHRNTIRQDMGNVKKREIYDKLEQNLEQQIFNVFKMTRLIDTKEAEGSLGYVPEKNPYARLLPLKNHDPVSEAFLILVGEKEEDEAELDPSKNNVLFSYILTLIDAQRTDKTRIYLRPKLSQFLKLAKALFHSIVEEPRKAIVASLEKCVSNETNFIDSISKKHLTDALNLYSGSKEKERRLLTKSEHDKRLMTVANYLESVAVVDKESLMAKVSEECSGRWEKGCEAISLSGVPCQLMAHPSPGDQSINPSQWQLHSSAARYVSTCGCGHRQALREDPFSLKEANYDFYHLNPIFICCSRLDMHSFKILDEKETEEIEGHVDEGQWVAAQPEPRLLLATREQRSPRDGSLSEEDEEDETNSDTSSEEEDREPRTIALSPIDRDSSPEDEPHSYLDDSEETIKTHDTDKKQRELVVEYEEGRIALKGKNVHFCDGVPHSRVSGLPLFASFQMSCLGRSSIYSHQYGLRDMPGFKPGADYLLPYDVVLEVDSDNWSRDMNYVQELVSTSDFGRSRLRRQRHGTNLEKIKLFIGFEYECPRGHRMFLGADLEPLATAKGSAKELISKEAAAQLLARDLPIWRPCTCRKLPAVNAQLMRVHVVTPKAPVSVTIDPKIQTSLIDEGYFHTGETPLELSWARYYIVRLPFAYSGENGPIIPPSEIGSHGRFKANCISVSYTPLTTWIH